MDDGFSARPAELTAAAAPFDEAASVVAEALAALRSTLDSLGAYLGTDEQGRAFAAGYEPRATEGLAAVDHEARTARSLGDALRSTGHDYAARDAGLTDGLTDGRTDGPRPP